MVDSKEYEYVTTELHIVTLFDGRELRHTLAKDEEEAREYRGFGDYLAYDRIKLATVVPHHLIKRGNK